MNVAGEALLVRDALQQITQDRALVLCERGEQRLLMLARNLSDRGKHFAALIRESEGVATAVVRAAAALGEAEGIEFVEKRNEAAGNHAEGVGQRLLGESGRRGQDVQDAGMRGGEAQFRDALAEAACGVAADLGEEEGRAEAGLRGGPGGRPRIFRVFHRIYCCT